MIFAPQLFSAPHARNKSYGCALSDGHDAPPTCGPPHTWFTNVGAGAPIPGNAPAFGVVNYTELKFSKKDFLSLRPVDYIVDFKGERSGFATTMASWTAGVTHRFNELISVRPEVRYEHAFSARPWDNGQRKDQFMFAIDALLRF